MDYAVIFIEFLEAVVLTFKALHEEAKLLDLKVFLSSEGQSQYEGVQSVHACEEDIEISQRYSHQVMHGSVESL